MLSSLLLPLSSLHGVGAAIAQNLTKLVGRNKIFALLLHKPTRLEPIAICPRLFEVQNDELIVIKAKVESHLKPATNRQPYKVICYNPTGYLNLIFFKIFPGQAAKMKVGAELAILGNLSRVGGENQIVHPLEILPANEIEKMPRQHVVYPLIAGITQKFLNKKITEILAKIPDDELGNALKVLHYFRKGDVERARRYLAGRELLAWQIAVLLAKEWTPQRVRGDKIGVSATEVSSRTRCGVHANLTKSFLDSLPFQLTSAQLKAITEIESELFSNKKMLRLLQGDVGSGKTVVAIATCLAAIKKQQQACVIAPTTVLAKQHLKYFSSSLNRVAIRGSEELSAKVKRSSALCAKDDENWGVRVELLISATTKKQRDKILADLASGEIDILISTHAALEDDVKFKNLGLGIIDEQHRFGVMQRLRLVEKGRDVDLLLMSATPIPRSLMMALYGDMDISVLDEKPQNRQKIETVVMSAKKSVEVHEAMKRAVLRGEKIYWICPAIEENKEIDLASVKKKFDELVQIFGVEKVGLLHGQMKEKDKEKVMNDFGQGDLRILVATTVIEVGIDVPDATVILIENAESFGLSQLHQLRGRVGRSDKKSFCILLYGENVPKRTFSAKYNSERSSSFVGSAKYNSERSSSFVGSAKHNSERSSSFVGEVNNSSNWRKRLSIMRESDDGFFLAEEDLKMRGSGDLLGTKQSGFPEFRIADLNVDADLLLRARKEAEIALGRGVEEYQELLQLFDYDDCLRFVAGG